MPLSMNNTLCVKTDEDIISEVNAKSHLTVGCYGLDEGTGLSLVDAFGNLSTIALGEAPGWNSGTSGEPDGFAEFTNAVTPDAFYKGDSTDATEVAHFKTKGLTGNLFLNLWIWSGDVAPSSAEVYLQFGSSAGTNYELRHGGTDIDFNYDDGVSSENAAILDSSLTADTWHMVSVDISAAAVDLYLDGSVIDSIATPTLNIDPADNTGTTDRSLMLFVNGIGGGTTFKLGSSTRTVYLAKFLSIKSTTSLASKMAALTADLYRVGPGKLAPALANL